VSVTKVSAALMEAGTKGADIASTGTMVIGTDGSYFDITGTTGITAMTVDVGRIFTLQFDGAVVLTHSSTLYLAGAANFTTEANDHLTFVAVAANDVRQIGAGLKDGGSPVAAGGGDLRNFIIDGDFTQWPEGTDVVPFANSAYGPALWQWFRTGGEIVVDATRSTDVPTVAESGHQSTYAFEIDVTTAESAVAAGDYGYPEFIITGSDFTYLHQQEVTFNFWHKHTKTGTYCVAFSNSALDRSYIAEYTQSTTNTWEEATITLTLDTSGTWLFTEADKGLRVYFTLFSGSTYDATANTWSAGHFKSTTNQVDGCDSASNFCRFSQVGLYLGSTAPTFLGESVATVKDQVAYYINRETYDNATSEPTGHVGQCNTTTNPRGQTKYARPMRIVPTVTFSAAATFDCQTSGAVVNATGVGSHQIGRYNHSINMTVSGGVTGGNAWTLHRDGTDACYIQYDARH